MKLYRRLFDGYVVAALSLSPACLAQDDQEVNLDGQTEDRLDLGTPSTPSDAIKLASWNIFRFRHTKNAEVIREVAEIISKSKYDIIALQEVIYDPSVPLKAGRQHVYDLESELEAESNEEWHAIVSGVANYGIGGQDESYAVLWRDATIEWLQEGGLVRGSRMWHAPYFARFRAKAGGSNGFDFILMVAHAKTRGKITQFNVWNNSRDILALREDIERVRSANPLEPDVIVVGDFNVAPSSRLWAQAFRGLHWALGHGGSSGSMAGKGLPHGLPPGRLNDNLVWGAPTQPDFTGYRGIDLFDLVSTGGGPTYPNSPPANKRLSDHRPVWAMFYVDRDND